MSGRIILTRELSPEELTMTDVEILDLYRDEPTALIHTSTMEVERDEVAQD